MPDYETMYHKLFIEISDAIDRFQKVLLEMEELYISESEKIVDIAEVLERELRES